MQKGSVKLTIAIASIVVLSACETMGSKEYLGSVLGGVAGGILGDQASDKNKELWTIAGGFAGAYIGNKIGQYLDEQDRQKMAQVTQNAALSGRSQNWSNPKNNTSGTARVISSTTKTEVVKVPVLKSKVKQVPPLDIIGQTYRAKRTSNLRGGPGTDYVKVGKLTAGEAINVVGKVKQGNWYLISHDGVGSGFIFASLVEPAPSETPKNTGTAIAKNDVMEQDVSSSYVCRTIEQSITLSDGSKHSETIEACQGPNGWEARV